MPAVRSPKDLDNRLFGREWPTLPWLPALTTVQALSVIVPAVIVSGFVPRIEIGLGFGLNPGGAVVGLGLAVAAFSPKRVRKS